LALIFDPVTFKSLLFLNGATRNIWNTEDYRQRR